jgi:hypothetical protein
LTGELGPADEAAGQLLSWGQAGVFDQGAGGGDRVGSPVSARIAAAPIAESPVIEVTSSVSPNSSSRPIIRDSTSVSCRCVYCQSCNRNSTRSSKHEADDGIWQLIGAPDADSSTDKIGHLHHAIDEDQT